MTNNSRDEPAGIITPESEQLSLFFRLLVLLALLDSLATFSLALSLVILDVLVIDIESLVNLGTQSSVVLNAIKR